MRACRFFKSHAIKEGFVLLLHAILLALSLSIDGFGLGVSYGIREIKIPIFAKCIIFLIALVFSFFSVFVGVQLSTVLNPEILKFLGVGILILLGGYIIVQNFKDDERYDLDHSKVIEGFEATYLGVALSLDSIGAGIACVALGFDTFSTPFIIAFSQLFFLCIGLQCGNRFSGININKTALSMSSGIIIILVGLFRLF